MKIVFDTNIYICAILSFNSNSAPSKLIEMAQEGVFDVFISSEMLQEIHHVLLDKLDFKEEKIQELIQEINFFTDLVVVTQRVKACTDPNDDFVLALAKQVKADFLVTLDRKHLISMKKFEDTKIIYPSDFLEIL